jgi:hypothetical protein
MTTKSHHSHILSGAPSSKDTTSSAPHVVKRRSATKQKQNRRRGFLPQPGPSHILVHPKLIKALDHLRSVPEDLTEYKAGSVINNLSSDMTYICRGLVDKTIYTYPLKLQLQFSTSAASIGQLSSPGALYGVNLGNAINFSSQWSSLKSIFDEFRVDYLEFSFQPVNKYTHTTTTTGGFVVIYDHDNSTSTATTSGTAWPYANALAGNTADMLPYYKIKLPAADEGISFDGAYSIEQWNSTGAAGSGATMGWLGVYVDQNTSASTIYGTFFLLVAVQLRNPY